MPRRNVSPVDTDSTANEPSDHGQPIPLITTPRGGTPALISTADDVARAAEEITSGSGPIAIDTERAQGFRYGNQAYLIQLKRGDGDIHLLDVSAAGDKMGQLISALEGITWIFHAAASDLPPLALLGLRPPAIYDTEVAARILNLPHVGLGGLLEDVLGIRLEKGHAASDWSRRPLPAEWLAYAALDVDYLLELWTELESMARQRGRLEWILEECEHIRSLKPAPPDPQRWRKLKGLHEIRTRRGLEIARRLWQAREDAAQGINTAPHMVLPHHAIIQAAEDQPASRAEMERLPAFSTPGARRRADKWWRAISAARRTASEDLPDFHRTRMEGELPKEISWVSSHPERAARLAAGRTALQVVCEEASVNREIILESDALRAVAWYCDEVSEAEVIRVLREHGARSWQIALCAAPLAAAMATTD